MTHLNIQQGLNIEVVSTNLIKKLYEAALSVPEPLEGELDAAYMSGNLLVAKTYRSLVEYLTNRFDDLHINVTDNYYVPFEDSAVLNVLLANNIGSDGIGVTEAEAADATFTSSTFNGNTDITSFPEFNLFTKANGNSLPNGLFYGCTNLTSINLSEATVLKENFARESGIITVNAPNLLSTSYNPFYGCTSLTTVESLGSLTTIQGFTNCGNLQTINIPSICTSIASKCFSYCTNLHLDVSTLPKSISHIGSESFAGGLSYVTGVLDLPNLTSLGTRAFQNANITGITCLGKSDLTNGGCFQQGSAANKLLYAYIPFECTTIGGDMFRNLTGLTTIKQYTDSVDDWVEGQTPTYTNISRVTTFESGCFRYCNSLSLTNADITNAVTIGNNAFNGCTLLTGSISLPNLGSLGSSAFLNTNITSVDFTGSNFDTIYQGTFDGCSNLTSVIVPITLVTYGQKTSVTPFKNTKIEQLVFPYGFKYFIGTLLSGTWGKYCQYIQYPSTVETISLHAIYEDTSNDRITCYIVILAVNPPITNIYDNLFGANNAQYARFYVPDNNVTDYKTDSEWSFIADYIFPISLLETDSPTNWARYLAYKDYGVPLNP